MSQRLIVHGFMPRFVRVITGYVGGGLGNQLFDYAALRTLCDRSAAQLVIDGSLLSTNSYEKHFRPLLLDQFSLRATIRDLNRADSRRPGVVKRVTRRLREDVCAVRVFRDPNQYGYSETFWQIPPRAIIRGHFLSPLYFKGNERAIRKDLFLPIVSENQSHRIKVWLTRIRAELNPVMVHVRRGDLLLPENEWLRLGDIEGYMQKAIDVLRLSVPGASFFFFSDDPGWCEDWIRNAGIDAVVVSSGEEAADSVLDDFRLMLACRHFIIPNSAFSWWAAFLSEGDGRRLMPAVWDPRGKVDLSEVLQPGWTSIS